MNMEKPDHTLKLRLTTCFTWTCAPMGGPYKTTCLHLYVQKHHISIWCDFSNSNIWLCKKQVKGRTSTKSIHVYTTEDVFVSRIVQQRLFTFAFCSPSFIQNSKIESSYKQSETFVHSRCGFLVWLRLWSCMCALAYVHLCTILQCHVWNHGFIKHIPWICKTACHCMAIVFQLLLASNLAASFACGLSGLRNNAKRIDLPV